MLFKTVYLSQQRTLRSYEAYMIGHWL